MRGREEENGEGLEATHQVGLEVILVVDRGTADLGEDEGGGDTIQEATLDPEVG